MPARLNALSHFGQRCCVHCALRPAGMPVFLSALEAAQAILKLLESTVLLLASAAADRRVRHTGAVCVGTLLRRIEGKVIANSTEGAERGACLQAGV
jgi:hypothetical protein